MSDGKVADSIAGLEREIQALKIVREHFPEAQPMNGFWAAKMKRREVSAYRMTEEGHFLIGKNVPEKTSNANEARKFVVSIESMMSGMTLATLFDSIKQEDPTLLLKIVQHAAKKVIAK